MAAAEAEWEPAGLLPAPGGGLDWGEGGNGGNSGAGGAGAGWWGASGRGRAGAKAAVSPAEAVLGEELSELLGAAEARRAPRDEPDVSTGGGEGGGGGGRPVCPHGPARGVEAAVGDPPRSSAVGFMAAVWQETPAGAPVAYRPSPVRPRVSC